MSAVPVQPPPATAQQRQPAAPAAGAPSRQDVREGETVKVTTPNLNSQNHTVSVRSFAYGAYLAASNLERAKTLVRVYGPGAKKSKRSVYSTAASMQALAGSPSQAKAGTSNTRQAAWTSLCPTRSASHDQELSPIANVLAVLFDKVPHVLESHCSYQLNLPMRH